ncbi:caspase family protein [Sinorhizobium meliloti]|uniref:caspase family protein n=1 Tax=Rhizobium meliloti TaxID=382 RepID=UPI0018E83700|nr:caspase family protein [Sinorhizobium meliloti]QQF06230.1 caspase family protein [Sinorhizobium meliloti]
MSLIFESDVIKVDPAAAATHVLLVGCGEYPSLAPAGYGGLPSLTSPRISVEAVANWFLTGVDAMPPGQGKDSSEAFCNEDAPLGSLVMLTSPVGSYETPFGTSVPITRPSIANLKTAYLTWLDRLKLNPESRGVFYFCGHGISDGETQFLVADDLGEDEADMWNAAFHLSMTVQASLRKARASLFYFIDACMELSEEIINQMQAPKALIGASRRGALTTTEWAIVRATTANRLAYAPEGGVAHFTQALLSALRGHCGVEHPSGKGYAVDVTRLRAAISEFLEFAQPDDKTDRQGIGKTEGDGNWAVPLHVLTKRPSVMLELDVLPPGFRPIAQAFIQDMALVRDTKPLASGPVRFVREHGEWTYGTNSTDPTSFAEKIFNRKLLTNAAVRRLIKVD